MPTTHPSSGSSWQRSARPIAAAWVDGASHPAFTRDTVILPPPRGEVQTVLVTLGEPASDDLHLTYISKPFTSLRHRGDTLAIALSQPELLTKLCASGDSTVLLGVDRMVRSRDETCGCLRAGSRRTSLVAQRVSAAAHVLEASVPLAGASSSERVLELQVGPGQGAVTLHLAAPPRRVLLAGAELAVTLGPTGVLTVPVASETETIPLRVELGACSPSACLPTPELPVTAPLRCSSLEQLELAQGRVDLGCSCRAAGPAVPGAGSAWWPMGSLVLLAAVWRRRQTANRPGRLRPSG